MQKNGTNTFGLTAFSKLFEKDRRQWPIYWTMGKMMQLFWMIPYGGSWTELVRFEKLIQDIDTQHFHQLQLHFALHAEALMQASQFAIIYVGMRYHYAVCSSVALPPANENPFLNLLHSYVQPGWLVERHPYAINKSNNSDSIKFIKLNEYSAARTHSGELLVFISACYRQDLTTIHTALRTKCECASTLYKENWTTFRLLFLCEISKSKTRSEYVRRNVNSFPTCHNRLLHSIRVSARSRVCATVQRCKCALHILARQKNMSPRISCRPSAMATVPNWPNYVQHRALSSIRAFAQLP